MSRFPSQTIRACGGCALVCLVCKRTPLPRHLGSSLLGTLGSVAAKCLQPPSWLARGFSRQVQMGQSMLGDEILQWHGFRPVPAPSWEPCQLVALLAWKGSPCLHRCGLTPSPIFRTFFFFLFVEKTCDPAPASAWATGRVGTAYVTGAGVAAGLRLFEASARLGLRRLQQQSLCAQTSRLFICVNHTELPQNHPQLHMRSQTGIGKALFHRQLSLVPRLDNRHRSLFPEPSDGNNITATGCRGPSFVPAARMRGGGGGMDGS